MTDLAKRIFDAAYLTGTFKLRSGIISSEYFDKYQFETRPALLKEIAEGMAKLLPQGFDLLAGLEMGGIPLATAISLETGAQMTLVRKKAKEYGTAKVAEGADLRGKKVVIIEDVVTSGGQIILSAGDLRAEGAEILCAICVIDREQGGAEKLLEAGIELRPLFTMSELKGAAGK